MKQVLQLLILLAATCIPHMLPNMPPNFHLCTCCTFHGEQEQSYDVTLSVSITGSPKFFIPAKKYEVKVESNEEFDEFFLRGLWTITSDTLLVSSSADLQTLQSQHSQICSHVYNYNSLNPTSSFSFIWVAPPKGAGCVSFLATAKLGHKLLFKDTTVLQLCEEGVESLTTSRPPLVAVHEDGLILRDDFESYKELQENLWASHEGVEIESNCGTILHGAAATFCEKKGYRKLMTVPLNITTGSSIQFTAGSGNCHPSYNDGVVTLSYNMAPCTHNNWTHIEAFRVETRPTFYLVHLPQEARTDGVCLQFQQVPTEEGRDWFEGCWALDNVLLVNTADPSQHLQDSFDPINTANWLFFPGGHIQPMCQSQHSGLMFSGRNDKHNAAITRDLELQLQHGLDQVLFTQFFEDTSYKDWYLKGGGVSEACSPEMLGLSVLMKAAAKSRQLCSPFMDLTNVGNIRFTFAAGTQKCPSASTSRVYVYAEDDQGHTEVIHTLELDDYREPKPVSLGLLNGARQEKMKLCWLQKASSEEGEHLWLVDDIMFFPLHTFNNSLFIQFSLNVQCAAAVNNSVSLEFSTDHGATWQRLYEPCLPFTSCKGTPQLLSSVFTSQNVDQWTRFTLPIPLAAQTMNTRFRWLQVDGTTSNWGLDNVYIGRCPEGCSGHGQCTVDGCYCDFGYKGVYCEENANPLPSLLVDNLATTTSLESNFAEVRGGSLGYNCGVLGSGKALVFSQAGPRLLTTRDVNLTAIRYIQFSVRLGSNTNLGSCPGPDHPSESILLQYTCSGGIYWDMLAILHPRHYSQPLMVTEALPDEAQCPMGRIRWLQAQHSGSGQDVWALDDIALTTTMHNTIELDFNQTRHSDVRQSLDTHLAVIGGFCGKTNTLRFTNTQQASQARYVATSSMHVGPSYLLQFELSMGCQTQHHLLEERQPLWLQYSTDHGMSWAPVLPGCWPPHMCDEYHQASEYHATQYQDWSRISIKLPPHTWSSSTRFRWYQEVWTKEDQWAISDLYIGQQCPELCHGHGSCHQALCICDPGFSGPTCLPDKPLSQHLKTSFSMVSDLPEHWTHIHGGELAGAGQGCRTILSGESLYFAKGGPRLAESRDLDLSQMDYIQFYFRLGGSDSPACQGGHGRQEGVLLQHSSDGGVSWSLLKELHYENYRQPGFVHVTLPKEARSSLSRLRWWQPVHSGRNHDQWAIDEVSVGHYEALADAHDDFQLVVSERASMWLTITEGMYGTYCHSKDDTLMFAPLSNDKFAMTKDLLLQSDYVIQFKINVGCSGIFSHQYPVLLQWSSDAGMSWQLVQDPCYVINQCTNNFNEGSIYFTGTHGNWSTVVLPVTPAMLKGPVNLRWWQQGGGGTSFALDDVYIGVACPKLCQGHGTCLEGKCICEPGYTGDTCNAEKSQPHGIMDRFDEMYTPRQHWQQILGGRLGSGCGTLAEGNSLYFDGDGAREARTVPLNTTDIMMLEFLVRIGSKENRHGCKKPKDHDEAVIVDFSLDNGINWEIIKTLDPMLMSDAPQQVTLPLPQQARSPSTTLRWWQPILTPDKSRAEWALDNIVIGVNESSREGFQENFDPIRPDIWYMAMNALPKITCDSDSNALEFSKMGKKRYAETWDYIVTPWTFLQFDIAMGCSGTYSTLYEVMLQYSTDMGKTWQAVLDSCLPPNKDCNGYHLSSSFSSQNHANWTRITLYLPSQAVSGHTRFRWLQDKVTLRGNVWALDNIYLGEGCPWMCSGHGRCVDNHCVCDAGYGGPFCVALRSLPMDLRDSFDLAPSSVLWPDLYGGEISHICGTLVSGTALVFFKDKLRMLVSRDLDVSMSMYLQFMFQFGCLSSHETWPLAQSVLIQYSVNGGIRWHLLTEIPPIKTEKPRLMTITLPSMALSNSTRFRFWQPQHDGSMQSVWAVDNVQIGGSMISTDTVYETFDNGDLKENWIFWPGGKISQFCHFNIRSPTIQAGTSSLVFSGSDGERSVTTRDMYVNDLTVAQFDINVGCTNRASHFYPIRFEYSTDLGKTWQLVVAPCGGEGEDECVKQQPDVSVYYAGTSEFWQRVVIPLQGLNICGLVRFRWTQGLVLQTSSLVADWSLDNVYIGMQCVGHCHGHGTCIQGMVCQCDDGFDDSCLPEGNFPMQLLEDFEGNEWEWQKFDVFSGGQPSDKCGTLLSGRAMLFTNTGLRVIATRNLNLTHASVIQFMLKLGCGSHAPVPGLEPVYLQFTTNGGISWQTMERFDFSNSSDKPQYFAVQLPDEARTSATRVRWMQNTHNGTYSNTWAVDQIFIGGNIHGRLTFHGDTQREDADSWLMYPGASLEPACASPHNAFVFSEQSSSRYAVSADVTVTEATYLQFSLTMACSPTTKCFEVELQFSLDLGKTWHRLQEQCLPSQIQCRNYHRASVYHADRYFGWHRVTYNLPPYTRSKATRFRWIQKSPYDTSDWWAIKDVYIGDECRCSCGGHGSCIAGKCLCDEGWTGNKTCTESKTALLPHLSDDFTSGPQPRFWSSVHGALTDTQCGVMASGPSLHFTGSCSREAVTVDLDLRSAMFMQLYFRFGCLSAPTTPDQAVLVDYSTDAGITWTHMIQLYHDQFNRPSFISVDLPEGARHDGVRIRLWQPTHPGVGKADWAVDNVIIGGNLSSPDLMSDAFQGDAVDDISWLQHDNLLMGEFCSQSEGLHGVTGNTENVTLMTQDMHIKEGYMLQFSITVGCGSRPDEGAAIVPVYLQYSLDHGMTWELLVEQCMPSLPHCQGRSTTPSIYYPDQGWHRVTIPLGPNAISRSTRFRWTQTEPDSVRHSARQWGIQHVFIGPACDDMCHGHGTCDYPTCHCDKGYYGDRCQASSKLPEFMKDTFDGEGQLVSWNLVQGATVGEPCLTLASDSSLHFTAPGLRQAVTTDLDLRNARFVQYYALIGGPSSKKQCGRPESRNDSVAVQYSVDGGVVWHTLHLLDHVMYWERPHHDYIALPSSARTHSTRLRWWQMTPERDDSHQPANWALDNVYIGGSQVNPSLLYNAFSENIDEKMWEFYPNGRLENNVCGSDGAALLWPEMKGVKSLTTGQLIVQESYMIQFKDPSKDAWSLVVPECLLDGHKINMECRPFTYSLGSIYSANTAHNWTRVTLPLPPKTFSSETRFRWVQVGSETASSPSWGLDDVYIGESCPQFCNGRGDCRNGKCICDPGYLGKSCEPDRTLLLSSMIDTMEGGVVTAHWERVSGGSIGLGCGALLPHAHGKSLYFNGCGLREAVTVEMDTTRTSKIMFVLQIGSHHQASSCNVDLDSADPASVLLLYSTNKGIDWTLLASHEAGEYLRPRKVSYNIPAEARTTGMQLRWWQPQHRGKGHDQWAIDHVEIVMTLQEKMFRTEFNKQIKNKGM